MRTRQAVDDPWRILQVADDPVRTCSAAAATRGSSPARPVRLVRPTASVRQSTCGTGRLRSRRRRAAPEQRRHPGPAVIVARLRSASSPSRSRRVRCRTAGSCAASNHATAPAVGSPIPAGSQISRPCGSWSRWLMSLSCATSWLKLRESLRSTLMLPGETRKWTRPAWAIGMPVHAAISSVLAPPWVTRVCCP